MLVAHGYGAGIERNIELTSHIALDLVAQLHDALRTEMVGEDKSLIAPVGVAFVVVGGSSVVDLISMQSITRLGLDVSPDIGQRWMTNRHIVVGRAWIGG